MKKGIFILFFICILFSACKKENEDYRDQVLGTYTGILHYYPDAYNGDYTTQTVTTIVTKSDTIPDILIFTGGLINYYSFDFILNNDYSLERVYSTGYFRNDSLIFDLKRHYSVGKYFLRNSN